MRTWANWGTGTTTDRLTPPATDLLTGIAAVAATGEHTCVLTTAGGVRCWGDNFYGQLGVGGVLANPTPTAVAGTCP